MSHQLFVVAGQSNARRFDATGIMTGAIADAEIEGSVVRVVEGGTGMAARDNRNDWYPFEDGDPNTGELVQALVDAVQVDLAQYPGAELGAFVWMQGETDANVKFESSDYAQKLQGLYDLLQAEFGTDFAFILTRLSDNAPGSLGDNVGDWGEVQAAQDAFAAANDGVILIDPNDVAAAVGIAPEDMFRDPMHLVDPIYEVIADMVTEISETFAEGPTALTGTGLSDGLSGTAGDDVLLGYRGGDRIVAGEGNDSVNGGRGIDLMYLGLGDDLGRGQKGNDHIFASNGNDQILGGRGNDTLSGGQGDDLISGNNNRDKLAGGNGADTLRGGEGKDTLIGGAGDDLLRGDDGADVFEFRLATDSGRDLIYDFETGTDRIEIVGTQPAGGVGFVDLGGSTLVEIGDTQFEVLTGQGQSVDLSDIFFV